MLRITLGAGTKKINTSNSIDLCLIISTIVHQNPASQLILRSIWKLGFWRFLFIRLNNSASKPSFLIDIYNISEVWIVSWVFHLVSYFPPFLLLIFLLIKIWGGWGVGLLHMCKALYMKSKKDLISIIGWQHNQLNSSWCLSS